MEDGTHCHKENSTKVYATCVLYSANTRARTYVRITYVSKENNLWGFKGSILSWPTPASLVYTKCYHFKN